MDFETAKAAFEQIEEIREPELVGLRQDMYQLAVRYAHLRVEWDYLDDEGKRVLGQNRHTLHNAYIDACNILSRAIVREGVGSAEWRRFLGNDRKEIGDFACYLTCFLGLRTR